MEELAIPVFRMKEVYPIVLRLMYTKLDGVTFEETLHFVKNFGAG